jgi:hypothetical protein
MDKLKEFFKKPISMGAVGLVIGLIIGLVGLGWGLWPLQWTDAAPSDLRADYQRDYLCMTIDSFSRNPNADLIAIRWIGLGENAQSLLDSLTPAACRFETTDEINTFREIIALQAMAEGVVQEPTEGSEVEETPIGAMEDSFAIEEPILGLETEPVEEPARISILPLAIMILLTLVVGGVLIFVILKRAKSGEGVKIRAPKIVIPKKAEESKGAPDVGFKAAANDSPLAQFMTTYRQGDDLYDDSFSVDSITGEFLGECGVGIAETIGVGEPKKVTALEVWLFDKNDIQTVTKVLLSEHANNDAALRQRLLSKGEPILVEPGMKFLMETETLQLEARVVDMVYARGPLPENSYFSRLTLEISVWSK